MGNYIDHKLSARVSREFRRVLSGKTDITVMDNGDEVRNARWRYKKLTFTANFVMLSQEAQEELMGAFWAANAQLLLFRFRDYGDYVVTNSPLDTSAVAGTITPIQLTKRYTFGPATADRPLQAVSTVAMVDSNGDTVTGTLDNVLGMFTPDSPWDSDLTYSWSGTFDVWVRFNSDDFDTTMHMSDLAEADVELSEQKARR